jgi:hypothetical protein
MLNLLNSFLNDLSKYKRNKKDLMEFYINDRLSKSLEVYYSELYNSLSYLVSKNDLRVLKTFNKINGD